MSEAAPERAQPRTAGPAAARPAGNVLTRKYGPLPGWGWLGVGAAGGLVFLWWRSRQNAAAAAAAAPATSSDTTGGGTTQTDFAGEIATLQAEIQQLQGDESTEDGPPVPPPGPGPKKKPRPVDNPHPRKYVRHVSTGRESLLTIAQQTGESIANLLGIAKQSQETPQNIAKLVAWSQHPARKEKGVVYYTLA